MLKQVSNISILFQKQSIRHGRHFKFLKIFYCQCLKKCFKKAVEAFKVWASKRITAGRKFSKCVLEAKTSLKYLNIVSEAKYGSCRSFSVFKDFPLPIFEKVLQKGCRGV